MNPTHGRDLEGQPVPTQYLYTSHCLLQRCMHTLHLWKPVFPDAAFYSAHPTLFSFIPHTLSPFLLLFLPCGFLSFFLSLILSLRPIFCLIAHISSTSRCPNSESVHFNLIVSLVGMMDSLPRFAAGFANHPVHPDRHVKCEMVSFSAPKQGHFYLFIAQHSKFVNIWF